MERLKTALKLNTNSELAQALGLKRNAFYNRKASGSIPYAELVELTKEHEICVDWVLFGVGTPFRNGGEVAQTPMSVDAELLGEIAVQLEVAFGTSASTDAGDRAATLERAFIRSHLAAMIYTKVQFIAKGRGRTTIIRSEARSLADVARLMERLPAQAKRGSTL